MAIIDNFRARFNVGNVSIGVSGGNPLEELRAATASAKAHLAKIQGTDHPNHDKRDYNGDGVVSKNEVNAFDIADKNNNEKLDFFSKEGSEYKKIDANGDHIFSDAELRAARKAEAQAEKPAAARKVAPKQEKDPGHDKRDYNGDDTVSLNEAKAFALADDNKDGKLNRFFSKERSNYKDIDANKDGVFSDKELEAAEAKKAEAAKLKVAKPEQKKEEPKAKEEHGKEEGKSVFGKIKDKIKGAFHRDEHEQHDDKAKAHKPEKAAARTEDADKPSFGEKVKNFVGKGAEKVKDAAHHVHDAGKSVVGKVKEKIHGVFHRHNDDKHEKTEHSEPKHKMLTQEQIAGLYMEKANGIGLTNFKDDKVTPKEMEALIKKHPEAAQVFKDAGINIGQTYAMPNGNAGQSKSGLSH